MNVNVRSGLRFGVVLLVVTVGSMATARAEESEGKVGLAHFRPRDIKGPYGFSCSGAGRRERSAAGGAGRAGRASYLRRH